MTEKQRDEGEGKEAEWGVNRNDEWPDPNSRHLDHQKSIGNQVKGWAKHQWDSEVKPYASRLGEQTMGIVVLGAILGAGWVGISPETIIESLAVQSIPTQQQWIFGLFSKVGKVVVFWIAGWAGVALIFSHVRDSRSLSHLFAHRPVRTLGACLFLTIFSFFGLALGWVMSRLVLTGEILNVTWWQSLAGVAIILIFYVAMIDWGYRGLYSQPS